VIDIAPVDADVDPVRQARALVPNSGNSTRACRKPRWIVLNKIDLVDATARERLASELRAACGPRRRCFLVSAATGEGCRD